MNVFLIPSLYFVIWGWTVSQNSCNLIAIQNFALKKSENGKGQTC